LPTLGLVAGDGVPAQTFAVGTWDGRPCVALAFAGEPPPGLRRIGLRAAHAELGERGFALAGRAWQLLEWDRTHRFCGHCGTPTAAATDELVRRCPSCGLSVYPRISPVIMVLIVREREFLLARGARHAPGMYSALAGFVEAGETLEETVAREVREEVGVAVDELRYFGSQSWPFPNSLMIAFTARYAGGAVTPDGVEIEDARWFPVDALPTLPRGISIAHRLITTVAARMTAT
jgi:NAD+ diphosphatase